MQQKSNYASPRSEINVDNHWKWPSVKAKGMTQNGQISASVWMQISRNGSSGCSATAIIDRITVSDIGTTPGPLFISGSRRSVPTSTIIRMSLMTCSFSTACLLSRRSDLWQCLWVWILSSKGKSGSLQDVPIECITQTTNRSCVNQWMSNHSVGGSTALHWAFVPKAWQNSGNRKLVRCGTMKHNSYAWRTSENLSSYRTRMWRRSMSMSLDMVSIRWLFKSTAVEDWKFVFEDEADERLADDGTPSLVWDSRSLIQFVAFCSTVLKSSPAVKSTSNWLPTMINRNPPFSSPSFGILTLVVDEAFCLGFLLTPLDPVNVFALAREDSSVAWGVFGVTAVDGTYAIQYALLSQWFWFWPYPTLIQLYPVASPI